MFLIEGGKIKKREHKCSHENKRRNYVMHKKVNSNTAVKQETQNCLNKYFESMFRIAHPVQARKKIPK